MSMKSSKGGRRSARVSKELPSKPGHKKGRIQEVEAVLGGPASK